MDKERLHMQEIACAQVWNVGAKPFNDQVAVRVGVSEGSPAICFGEVLDALSIFPETREKIDRIIVNDRRTGDSSGKILELRNIEQWGQLAAMLQRTLRLYRIDGALPACWYPVATIYPDGTFQQDAGPYSPWFVQTHPRKFVRKRICPDQWSDHPAYIGAA